MTRLGTRGRSTHGFLDAMPVGTMVRMVLLGLVVAAGACSRGESADAPEGSRELDGAEATVPASPRTSTLPRGTRVEAVTTAEISSRQGAAGDAFSSVVFADVVAPDGTVVIPAGATLRGTILEVSAAPDDGSLGTLLLHVSSATVRGTVYPLSVSIDSLMTVHEGRGLERADVIRVAGGAAAGAAAGQLISKNTKGTVIGGIIGAATGGAVSALVKDRDIVLPSGAHLMLTLLESVSVQAAR